MVVDTIDSVGLPGRSGIGGGVGFGNKEVVEELAMGDVTFRRSRGVLLATLTEDVEPFIVASLRRKSSNGAPVLLDSAIDAL